MNPNFNINMKNLFTLIFLFFTLFSFGQTTTIIGEIISSSGEPVAYANVVLLQNEQIFKVETTDDNAKFQFVNIPQGIYQLNASFIGYDDISQEIVVQEEALNLGVLEMTVSSVELETAVVTARRALVEVKPDRTVFYVEGTINSAGDNVMGLLRKAPGVVLDNNDNITVLGRSGVLVYVDGKRLPMVGDELTNYLQSIPSEQIDRIDIISSPGAKYEAEGNAGIIDIRLKKSQNVGVNGTLSGAYSIGRYPRYNLNLSGNRRSEKMNVFGSVGYNKARGYNDMLFTSDLNNIFVTESTYAESDQHSFDTRLGVDYFVSKNATIGALYSGGISDFEEPLLNRIELSPLSSPSALDSILIAENQTRRDLNRNAYNLNYVYNTKSKSLNIDVDYAQFRNDTENDQPNIYYDPTESFIVSQNITYYETPTDIDIYTFKTDYEQDAAGGRLGFGTKLSQVATENQFLFFDANSGENELIDSRSNDFDYDEKVYAAYANYSRQLDAKWSLSSGLRVEITDAVGDLVAYDPSLQEPPVELNYTNYFPNIGLNYGWRPMHNFNLNYGRRINRPDYNVLNPFRTQLSEISFMKGNPFLNPEIVNNYEFTYTYAYRYNFKLSYSRTTDQITRLIGPDLDDLRSTVIAWDNLTTQDVYGFNMSLPNQLTEWWSSFINFSCSYIDNQADYGDGAVVDVQAFNYTIFGQQTFNLPSSITGEVSGFFSGPGVWGGVFEYDPSWSLNMGLQKKFLNKKLNVKLSVEDIFYQTGWSGGSFFDGLTSTGRGNWDSRRASVSVSYNFGNNKLKTRNRKTGIEEESKRVGS